jgi:hypothetical protein
MRGGAEQVVMVQGTAPEGFCHVRQAISFPFLRILFCEPALHHDSWRPENILPPLSSILPQTLVAVFCRRRGCRALCLVQDFLIESRAVHCQATQLRINKVNYLHQRILTIRVYIFSEEC